MHELKAASQNVILWVASMAFALILLTSARLAFGEEKTVHPIAGVPVAAKSISVDFKANATGQLGDDVAIPGSGCKATAELTQASSKLSGKITVDLMSCTTGPKEEKRDGHMKEDFKTAGAATAVCTIKDFPMKGAGSFNCEPMTIGKASVTQAFSYQWAGSALEAKIDTKLSTFNIPRRTFLNAKMQDPVTVSVKLAL